MRESREKNISKFDSDTARHGGYVYTSNERLSSELANDHITQLTLSLVSLKGKSVFDIGCGDRTYTIDLFEKGSPKSVFGIDPSQKAVRAAGRKNPYPSKVSFEKGNIYSLPKKRFDIAIVRGVLHHLYHPEKAMEQISKTAKKILIIEPNGYNPILKIIEKTSKYHKEHEEKSYPPYLIDQWIRRNSGTIKSRKFAGLVPFFCPDYFAVVLKKVESIIEEIPLINKITCAQYYVIYDSKQKPKQQSR